MDDIIKELVRIEGLAKGITDEMNTSRNEFPERIKRRRREIDDMIENELSGLMATDEERCRDEAETAIQEIQRKTQKFFSDIEKEFFANAPGREEEIFSRIIGMKI